ncbi:hypothetical protein D3C87_1487520 [compost metagenome]
MRSAAGLQIDITDAHQPDPTLAHGRLDLHGLDKIRLRFHLRVGDPFGRHQMVGLDHGVERRFQGRQILGDLRHVEIEPALVLANGPTGHREGKHHRQQVQGRMHAHQAMATVPIDIHAHRLANLGKVGALGRNMDDLRLVTIGMHSRCNRNDATVGPHHLPAVTGLPARRRIKHRSIQHDAA